MRLQIYQFSRQETSFVADRSRLSEYGFPHWPKLRIVLDAQCTKEIKLRQTCHEIAKKSSIIVPWARHSFLLFTVMDFGRYPKFLFCLSSVLRWCNRWVLVMKTRIMYIERKVDVLGGPARIERVTFSKSGQSVYYRKRRFETLGGRGHKANYFDSETDERY
jgi:hypothetical protein